MVANEKNMQIGGRWFITLMVTKAVQISLDIKYALRDAAVMSKFHYSTKKGLQITDSHAKIQSPRKF